MGLFKILGKGKLDRIGDEAIQLTRTVMSQYLELDSEEFGAADLHDFQKEVITLVFTTYMAGLRDKLTEQGFIYISSKLLDVFNMTEFDFRDITRQVGYYNKELLSEKGIKAMCDELTDRMSNLAYYGHSSVYGEDSEEDYTPFWQELGRNNMKIIEMLVQHARRY